MSERFVKSALRSARLVESVIERAAFVAPLLLSSQIALGADKATLVGFTQSPGVELVTLVDRRPAEEKTKSPGSLNVANCNYAVYRVPDDLSEPSRMTLLRSDLAAALGAQLEGRSVVVTHYGIYVNNAKGLRSSASASAAGVGAQVAGAIGAAPIGDIGLAGMGADCPPEKMNGGWYGDGEVTTEFSPIVAELVVEVDGRQHAVRKVVSSPKRNVRIRGSDPTFVAMLFDAMRGVTTLLVTELRTERD